MTIICLYFCMLKHKHRVLQVILSPSPEIFFGNKPAELERQIRPSGESLVHILSVAGIYHRNGVSLDGVGVVPFVGIRHVVALPSADGWAAARQRSLYGVDGEESIAHVALHIFVRIGVLVILGHVPVETSYLGSCTLGIEILILHIPCRRRP